MWGPEGGAIEEKKEKTEAEKELEALKAMHEALLKEKSALESLTQKQKV